jgi:hypothetical protein
MKRKQSRWCRILLLGCYLCAVTAGAAAAAPEYILSKGQTLYVSVYANIYTAPKKITYNLATILSIRNTDMTNPITVTAADFYDTRGKLLKRYYPRPIVLGPLESTHIHLPEQDTAGGTGANFIVRWSAGREVNAPVVESVMYGMRSGQGISFVSPAREIREGAR